MFQLEKIYGKSSDAKAFIRELCRGFLAKSCVSKSNHIIYIRNYMLLMMLISYLTTTFASIVLPTKKHIQGQQGVPHPQAWKARDR